MYVFSFGVTGRQFVCFTLNVLTDLCLPCSTRENYHLHNQLSMIDFRLEECVYGVPVFTQICTNQDVVMLKKKYLPQQILKKRTPYM